MTSIRLGEPDFCMDFLASEFHGDCNMHIDALCHIAYQGKLYNGNRQVKLLPWDQCCRILLYMLTALSDEVCYSISRDFEE